MSIPGKAELLIAGRVVDSFVEYSVSSDIYQMADAFHITMNPLKFEVAEGDECELRIGFERVMIGTAEQIVTSYRKTNSMMSIEGRDISAMLVDHHLETFKTLKGKTLVETVREILLQVDRVKRMSIIFKTNTAQNVAKSFKQITPGMTAFDVLRDVALGLGIIFYTRPNGTMVFGKPESKGEAPFSLVNKNGENKSGIIEAELTRDISERYSKITILGQRQGTGTLDATDINTKAEKTDEGVPYTKPYVAVINEDDDPEKRAELMLKQQRFRGTQLRYLVRGHMQGSNVWATDKLCTVSDDKLNVSGVFLVHARKLAFSRERGETTEVFLSEVAA